MSTNYAIAIDDLNLLLWSLQIPCNPHDVTLTRAFITLISPIKTLLYDIWNRSHCEWSSEAEEEYGHYFLIWQKRQYELNKNKSKYKLIPLSILFPNQV